MKCPRCQRDNPENARFCGDCGAALDARICRACGAAVAAAQRFCRSCGTALDSPSVPTGESRPARLEGERRQITVMFCDLVGSTALSARMDPEDLRVVIGAYHSCAAEVVGRYGGFVAQYLGDGVLVYFGYPQAHEDDAERAVRASLALVEAVERLRVASERLQVRVGIATGLVVVGELIGSGEAKEHGAIGETPNLAARLQAIANPNAVVIASATRRLVGRLFDYQDLGTIEVKGFSEPVSACQVLRPSVVDSRFEALRAEQKPLVGREEEIELLLRRWRQAKEAEGQVVMLSGEPGIGKSRTGAALVERLSNEPHIHLRYSCSPHAASSPLHPFASQLGRAAGFAPEDSPETKLDKLDALFRYSSNDLVGDVPVVAEMLSIPTEGRYPPLKLTPPQRKERTLTALLAQLEGLAGRQAVLMSFEDAHWIDPTSMELLERIVQRVENLPVLLVITFRPEFQPPWMGLAHVSLHPLNRLSRREGAAMIAQILGGKTFPRDVVDQIITRTDGVPLFVEELTKTVLESGLLREESDRYVLDRALPPLAIPTTLHASLLARLDRLGSVRLVAQIGAAIGREFPYALLHAVSRLPEHELQNSLAHLVASELVVQHGTPPDTVYSFKHALVQDAAHGTLLRSSRQQLHAQIAEALETHSPELMDSQPELFAQHYAEAGLVEQSVAYWRKASRRSAARSAMAEAAEHLQKGLGQLALLPSSRERDRQELEFSSDLGAAWLAVKGFAARETGQAYAHARELWERLGSPSEFLQVPLGQSFYHTYCGELNLAHRLDEALLRLSHQHEDTAGVILGHYSAGRTLIFTGGFTSSRSHLQAALARFDPISHGSLVHQVGIHPQVGSQAYLGIVLFVLGFADQALARTNAAIAEARRLAHLPSLAASLNISTRLLSFTGDDVSLDERVAQLAAVATEQGFAFWSAQATIYRGWVEIKNGNVAEGISLLRSGSAAYRATGAALYIPHHIALLAAACEIVGQIEESLTLLDEASQIVERTGERWLEAEIHRHKGQLLLRQGDVEAAEELYCDALSIAMKQEAKLWELRAAISLARLRRDQGRRAQARDLLAPVYAWFTEGFDTADLRAAATLLEELSAAPR